jgi:hypothetical protein
VGRPVLQTRGSFEASIGSLIAPENTEQNDSLWKLVMICDGRSPFRTTISADEFCKSSE